MGTGTENGTERTKIKKGETKMGRSKTGRKSPYKKKSKRWRKR